MDFSTTYMGLKLKNPLVPSASPLSREIDVIKNMEDNGAAAVVLYSLFEEQITHEAMEIFQHTTLHAESFAEAINYFPEMTKYQVGPEEYLEHIQKAKKAVKIPIIASLNGVTPGGWIDYAKKIEQAGADGIEINVYYIHSDSGLSGGDVEKIYLDTLKTVKNSVKIPVAMKLSPYFSSLAHFAKQLDQTGVNGLVLFNRFYQPDIDLETLAVIPNLLLSTPQSMRLPLRWVAILFGKINASLAATGGIHTANDVIKMLMVGADITMLCSTLLKNGVERISHILKDMNTWMVEHEYFSVEQMKGSMSHKSVADPDAFERVNYMRALTSYD